MIYHVASHGITFVSTNVVSRLARKPGQVELRGMKAELEEVVGPGY
jgi:hypothetical protein